MTLLCSFAAWTACAAKVLVPLYEYDPTVGTVVATYKIAPCFVEIDVDGGRMTVDSGNVQLDSDALTWGAILSEKLQYVQCTKVGYTLKTNKEITPPGYSVPVSDGGWLAMKDGYYLSLSSSVQFQNAPDCFAVVVAPNTYMVTLDFNDGENYVPMSVTYDSTYADLPLKDYMEKCRPGLEFVGWFTAAGIHVRTNTVVKITANQTLYAHWKDKLPSGSQADGGTEQTAGGGSQAAGGDVHTEEPTTAFNGTTATKMAGVVFGAADGWMRGIVQVETAKATAKGVKVKGFVMLEDGKKVSMKAATVPIVGGRLSVRTGVGKLGDISLEIGGDGFTGSLGAMKVASAELGGDAGVLSGSLTLKYIDATGKLKNRKIAIGGVATGGMAAGAATSKGAKPKAFVAEFE